MRGRRVVGRAALGACLLATVLREAPAGAGANRCGTEPPDRSPTWVDGAGSHWLDAEGLWTQAPADGMFGGGGVSFERRDVQADPWSNHSLQAYVSAERQCVAIGPRDIGGNGEGAYPIEPAPAIPDVPWLARDGQLFRADDGRSTILRGVDWPYDQEIFEAPYELTDADFERIASWGMNLLRVRIAGYRSGYVPGTVAEPGYWEHLDQLIAKANAHGIYVLPSTVTADAESMNVGTGHDQLKFIEGTSNHAWWMDYQRAVFERYRDWPGVVGFDTLNEDNSYPPYVHDRFFVGELHRDAVRMLRDEVGDHRHVYFQEPAGWSYWGAEWWTGMMQGHDIGDDNRFFCTKYKPGGNGDEEMTVKGALAVESNAPFFICEWWVDNADPATVLAWQRDAQDAMDERLIGGARVLYGPSAGYGTHTRDGVESYWIDEFARPYPIWAGGDITGVDYDYDTSTLVASFDLDGSGPTEVFTSAARTYPDGFVATASNGAALTWDAATERVILPPTSGPVTITIAPAS